MRWLTIALVAAVVAGGCGPKHQKPVAGTFGDDVDFLQKHGGVIILSDKAGHAQVAVSAALQGRVMTSTAQGPASLSFGWINRKLMTEGKVLPHFNPYGGEERFWLGPEGGQFSIFFAKGAKFDLEHWFVPPAIDTEPFDFVSKAADQATFRRKFDLTNYSGTKLEVEVNRQIRLLEPASAWKHLGLAPAAGVSMVAFESVSRLTNAGKEPWTKEKGLLSIWILSMLNPSPTTTIVVPIKGGPESELGALVNDTYFGKVPEDRLVIKDNVIFFSADGKYRSKIGVNPKRAKGVSGSYDATNRVLTIAQYTLPPDRTDYVNSMWEIQKDPFSGDTANCYNDGPPAPGVKPMGPFYELESSSPAAALAPGETIEHVHRTIHLRGPEAALDAIAKKVLGVGLKEITAALPRK